MSEGRGPTLVLGATGKTGSRVAGRLREQGREVRTAARSAADVRFDWDDLATHRPALRGAQGVYLMAPVLRTEFAPQGSAFLDLAEEEGVRHVTFLSAHGTEEAPPEVALRAVELDLIGRTDLPNSILRPAWFMQNFSETFLRPIDGAIIVPTEDGREAYVDAEDIAAVAADTLADPGAHAGAEYAPTGPEAITVAEAAQVIAEVIGEPVHHVSPDRDAWLEGVLATGVPAEYGQILETLTKTVARGQGARPNGDVETVTGARPTSFAEFAERTASAWAPVAVR